MAAEIPSTFTTSIVTTTLAFAAGVWLIAHITASRKLTRKAAWAFSITTAAILAAWFCTVYFLGKTDFFAANPLVAPNIILVFLAIFIVLQKAYTSAKVRAVADSIPPQWIIGIQTYRIVGWGFIILYQLKILPAAFAFPSGIGDILVGLTAPLVAFACAKKQAYAKKLAIAWNILGISDLVIAISIGILAFPRPIQMLPTAISTEPLSLFPLVLIPCFAVPLALLLHFFSLRAIKTANEAKPKKR